MSLSTTVKAMLASGCTPEQIAEVVLAHEEEQEKSKKEKRAKRAAQKRLERERRALSPNVAATGSDMTRQDATTSDISFPSPSPPDGSLPRVYNIHTFPPSPLPPSSTPKPLERARGSRLPPDWKPEGSFDQGELDRFRDYWIAKAGKDGIKLDWQATWRNWCRNSFQWKHTAHLDKPPETYRVGHAKGIFKREPEAPELTPEEKAERARRVDEILRGARRPVEGLGEVGS